LSENLGTLEWMRETIPKYELRVSINLRNLKDWSDEINYQNSYLYRVSDGMIKFKGEDAEIKTVSMFCKHRFESYHQIAAAINYQRRSLSSLENFKLQNIVYAAKVDEAKKILSGNIDELSFLNQEADSRSTTLDQIAKEVILQNEIAMGFLARTEVLRVKWLSKLKDSQSIEETEKILVDFRREMYEYHKLS